MKAVQVCVKEIIKVIPVSAKEFMKFDLVRGKEMIKVVSGLSKRNCEGFLSVANEIVSFLCERNYGGCPTLSQRNYESCFLFVPNKL